MGFPLLLKGGWGGGNFWKFTKQKKTSRDIDKTKHLSKFEQDPITAYGVMTSDGRKDGGTEGRTDKSPT